jgi:hypothetical protein
MPTTQAAKFRSTQAWRKAAAAAVADARRKDFPCALCGRVILYDAPPRSRYAPSVDHAHSLAAGGERLDRLNLQVTHVGCNSKKGAGPSAMRTLEQALVPVCDGRACSCAWLDDGSTDGCSKGPPVMTRLVRTERGWAVAR